MLFRDEVRLARADRTSGEIRLAQSLSSNVCASVALICALALVLFALFGQVTRKSRMAGLLVPEGGSPRVVATAGGVLVDVRIRQGEAVRRGQPMFVVDLERFSSSGATAQGIARDLGLRADSLRAERRSREQLGAAQRQGIDLRLESLARELRQAREEAVLAERRVGLARDAVVRDEGLAAQGFVAAAQLQQRQDAMLDLEARQGAVARTITALRRDEQALKDERQAQFSQLSGDLARIDGQLAALAQERTENDARARLIVTAPQDGMVAAIPVRSGQSVLPNQTLAMLWPLRADGRPAELRAELYASSRASGFASEGQPVWLRLAAFPYQKFGMLRGEVARVSRAPIDPQDLPPGQAQALLSAAGATEALYRLEVRLGAQSVEGYGTVQPLTMGMSVDADVVQERRAVWEWLLEPWLAVQRRWPDRSSDERPKDSRAAGTAADLSVSPE